MFIKRISNAQIKRFSAGIIALLVVVSFQNCSEQKISASANSSNGRNLNLGNTDNEATGVITQTGGPNCRNQLNQLTTPIKPVFVVDVSGSNFSNGSTGGTDPNRVVRGDSIERFYNTYKAKPNFGWSFTTFAQSAANVLLAMGNATQMLNAINTFRAMSDAGNTPYEAALIAARDNIQNDTGRAPGTKYIVVFLSDGMPNPSIADGPLNQRVLDVVNTVPGQVSLNTVYYGSADAASANRMKMMAQTGGGNFLDTNANPTGTNFLISDLVIVPSVVCQ